MESYTINVLHKWSFTIKYFLLKFSNYVKLYSSFVKENKLNYIIQIDNLSTTKREKRLKCSNLTILLLNFYI